MDALNGNSSLVFEIDATTWDSYNVNMGASPHEAHIPCAFEVPLISPNKSKILDAKIALKRTCIHPPSYTQQNTCSDSL
jgi:hypothetical protein